MIALLAACTDSDGTVAPPTGETGSAPTWTNVLVLLTDDQGVDKVAVYGEHPQPPRTPRMDALAAEGVLFRNAYATPICSPSRAALLTGRMGRRTGFGAVVQVHQGKELPLGEVTLPEHLAAADPPYANAGIGKWHIGAYNADNDVNHPNLSGFDRFSGTMGNLYDEGDPDGLDHGYYHWDHLVDGVVTKDDRYATTVQVDDALEAMGTLPEPWLVYVAFSAPHKPLDPPPPELGTYGDLTGERDEKVLYDAVVEALDTEIGRLLDSMDEQVRERTAIFLLSDNGTPDHAVRAPWDPRRGKDTPYEGGSNVPLVVVGPQVLSPGTETDALVHVVDVSATIAALAGAPDDGVERDGIPLLPLLADPAAVWARDVVHTEKFGPTGPPPYASDWRISRDDRFKLIDIEGKGTELFDLEGRVDDGPAIEFGTLSAAEQAEVEALEQAHEAFWAAIPPPAVR